jgi:hypothetical protein
MMRKHPAMVGCWVRPWRGEALVGEVFAVSGEWLICRAAGVEFRVLRSKVAEFMATKPKPQRLYWHRLGGLRLTEKALAS